MNQCQQIALEARSQNIQGQKVLNQVNTLHAQHKMESREIEGRLRLTMDKVSLSEGKLANSVGDSMLKLKHISDQQYIAMKDLALERKGIDQLWNNKEQEHKMNLQEVRHQKKDLEHSRQLLGQEKSSFDQHKSSTLDNARLTHRMYMNEQQHLIAVNKAQNSGGFLSRWARNFEEMNKR